MLLRNLMRRHNIQPAQPDVTEQVLAPYGMIDDNEGLIPSLVEMDGLDDQESRLQKVVEGGKVHATHLPDICPRQIALLRKAKLEVMHSERIDSNTRLIWVTGRAFEEHMRNQWVKYYPPEGLVGRLECKCGETGFTKNFWGMVSRFGDSTETNDVCTKCNTRPHLYKELPIFNDNQGVVSSPDFGYFNMEGRGVVVEIKSLKKDSTSSAYKGFVDITEAKTVHIRQALMYHLAATMNGANMADYVVVIYGSKGHVTGSPPYKEFKVYINDHRSIYENNRRLMTTGEVINTIDSDGNVSPEHDCGDGYPARVCASSGCATARKCQVSGLCFSIGVE